MDRPVTLLFRVMAKPPDRLEEIEFDGDRPGCVPGPWVWLTSSEPFADYECCTEGDDCAAALGHKIFSLLGLGASYAGEADQELAEVPRPAPQGVLEEIGGTHRQQ